VAKLDLLIGLDASGSMTEDGWKAQSTAMLDLLEKTKLDSKDGLQIGVAKFAWDITLVSHLTDDKSALTKAITDMSYDGWTTNLGGLFRTMKGMLQFGRRDAPSVCMTWTDGRPSYPSDVFDTAAGAVELRPVCRVMIVTMRPAVPREMVMPWVSHPQDQNVLSVDDPLEMTKKVDDITTFYCAKIQRVDDYLMGLTTTEAPKK
jgi:Mg-chelatase subunit ChlD